MIGQFHPRAILVNVLPASHNYRSTIELAESIKHNSGAAIPVIECSLPSQAWIANYMSVTGCLTKPISIQSFQDQIGRVSAIERLMVLDDDRAFCRLIERMIASAYPGMKLKQAYSGETGLKAIKAFKPDLLLLDLELPDISGFEVLEQLRLNPKFKNLAVVLVTGTSLAENYISQFGSGLTVYHQIGMKTKATLACLDAIVQQLQPRYQSEGSR
jgi:CheY-like chemotaxis protein